MKKQKMGLDSLKGKLSRAEMKNIMAGTTAYCIVGLSCSLYAGGQTYLGNCDAGFGGGSGGYMECGCSTQHGYILPLAMAGLADVSANIYIVDVIQRLGVTKPLINLKY